MICNQCQEDKSLTEFYNEKKQPCKVCRQLQQNAWRRDNRTRYLADLKRFDNSLAGKYRTYKKAAKQRDIEFNLTIEEFNIFWQKDCHYCGDPILTIGVDRVDSSEGYTLINCVPCCTICNKIKLNHNLLA